MSVTYGFYNSLNHDRKYDAIQFSSIFDGVINDGIYMAIGGQLRVSAGTGMTILVETGRAWFNHTWTLNDARLPLVVEQSEVILKRIDLVILEVNTDPAVRKNEIKIMKGIPSQNPVWPTVINEGFVHQYVLAAISVAPNVTSIRQADIENRVGMANTPFVTGIIQTINTDALIRQWKDQWDAFYEKETADISTTRDFWKQQYETFYVSQTNQIQSDILGWQNQMNEFTETFQEQMNGWSEDKIGEWNQWFNDTTATWELSIETWYNNKNTEFLNWFGSIRDILDSNEEGKIAADIVDLNHRVDRLGVFRQHLEDEQAIYYELQDSDTEAILDSQGRTIDARIIFMIKP